MESVDVTPQLSGELHQGELDLPLSAPASEPAALAIAAPAVSELVVTEVVPVPALEPVDHAGAWRRMGREVVAGVQTLLSAAVYATLIVTIG
jgi:hypothetical protein